MGNMADELLCDDNVYSSDYMFSSIKIGDYKDMSFDGCYDCLNLNLEWKDDVVNMLPSDPFEMNISGGCTMIRGWIQDDDDVGFIKIGDDINLDDTRGLFFIDETSKQVLHSINERNASCCNGNGDSDDDDGFGPPHDGLFYSLGYLEIRDLLSVEGVCKSLCDGVRNDPLLWRNIEIDRPPPGELFTDDSLLRITNRANGSLQTLSLDHCLNITDYGLKNVFQQNSGLTKLSVLGCNGLTIEGLLSNLKSFKSTGGNGIKRLRIGGLHNVTMEHYEDLKKILSIDNNQKPLGLKPRFYHGGQLYLSLNDNRPIDLEACPKCHQLRQIYDCPEEKCTVRHNYCRACTFCIPRCISCGCCFDERDYMETFCLDFLCLDCFTQILRFPDCEEEDIGIPGFHQQESYHFCLYG